MFLRVWNVWNELVRFAIMLAHAQWIFSFLRECVIFAHAIRSNNIGNLGISGAGYPSLESNTLFLLHSWKKCHFALEFLPRNSGSPVSKGFFFFADKKGKYKVLYYSCTHAWFYQNFPFGLYIWEILRTYIQVLSGSIVQRRIGFNNIEKPLSNIAIPGIFLKKEIKASYLIREQQQHLFELYMYTV